MTKLIAVVFSLSLLIVVIDLVRREKLTFKYAFAWMFVCVLAVVGAVFDRSVRAVAHAFGFELPSNFIFFTLLSVFVLLALLMTIFLCQQNNRNDAVAQQLAMLRLELDELKKKASGRSKSGTSD